MTQRTTQTSQAPPRVEEMEKADHEQVIDLLGEAFATHPMVPPERKGKPKHWGPRLMLGTMLNVFAHAPDAHLFAIRRDGKPVCAAFVHEYGFEPKGFALMGMIWQMVRVLGVRKLLAVMRVLSEKHPGDDRKLELLILGTRTECQRQGLGRVMVRHVIDYAAQRGYAAVTLEAVKQTPAFAFYQSEGFVAVKEIALDDQSLCYMRRDIVREGA